jgi:hypothetical protein
MTSRTLAAGRRSEGFADRGCLHRDFLHSTPTIARCVRRYWNPVAASRNLAAQSPGQQCAPE